MKNGQSIRQAITLDPALPGLVAQAATESGGFVGFWFDAENENWAYWTTEVADASASNVYYTPAECRDLLLERGFSELIEVEASSDITLDLDNLDETGAPLFRQYDGQLQPQPAYVEMDEDGEVTACYSGEIGNGVPSYVWHHRTLRWSVPSTVRGRVLKYLLERDDVVDLLERIHAGHAVDWDGNNHVGKLDADAQSASAELEVLLDNDIGGADSCAVWDAGEWLQNSPLADLWPAGQTLDGAENNVNYLATAEDVTLTGDVRDVLLDMAERRHDKGASITAEQRLALIEYDRIEDDELDAPQ